MALAPGKLTNSSNEAILQKVLSGDLVYQIPYFQRPYKWKKGQLELLERDITEIIDGASTHHFLGAIIIHGRKSDPSEASPYDVIDGQQRLTTVFLYICAAVKVFCNLEKYDEAASYFKKYLCISDRGSLISNIKLHPSGEDRRQLNRVLADLTANLVLKQKLESFSPYPLPDTGSESGPILKNYKHAVKYFERAAAPPGGPEAIHKILTALLLNMSIVQIDLLDPGSAPKIFDSLNSRQEPMTIGDLVRNEIFARVANNDYEQAEEVNKSEWEPFYKKFKYDDQNHFDDYFFPFGLIHDSNVSKTEVFGRLRTRWKSIESPAKIIADLSVYQNAFLDIVRGSNLQCHPNALAQAIKRTHDHGAPASVYPFVMQLSEAARTGQIAQSDAVAILEFIESFLVRRALSGIEPTGLHAVFKKLWEDCKDNRTAEGVRKAIGTHTTVDWAKDEEVIASIRSKPLAKSIRGYFVREYDRSLSADVPSNQMWIEHVLPQRPSQAWDALFPADEARKALCETAGNLIPLTSEMNRELSNGPYDKKRPKYKEDSAFKSARAFAERYATWTPKELAARNEELAKWAVKRWPA